MTVARILNEKGRDVAVARSDAPLSEVIETLAAKRIGAIVVCDRPRHVAGIISERDIVRAIARGGADILSAPVSAHMTQAVQTCTEAESIEACMARMTDGRFRHLPVVENGELIGIVSIGDVVKERIAMAEREAEAMRSYIVAG